MLATGPAIVGEVLVGGFEAKIIEPNLTRIKVSPSMVRSAGNGTLAPVLMERAVSAGTAVRHVPNQVSWVNSTRLRPTETQVPTQEDGSGSTRWATEDYIEAHKLVRQSGMHNFEHCRIPVPTGIKVDRIRAALGDKITPKESRVLELLEFGMPINCEASYGVKKIPEKSFFS